MVFIMNFLLLLWDIFLFASVGSTTTEFSKTTFSVILGAILAGNSLIYLILIPMMIAKVTQERIAQEGQRSCVAGTLVGTMLAVSLVGRFLISHNVATLLAYLTAKAPTAAWDDTIVVVLILSANLVLWSPIKAELMQVQWIRRRFVKEKVDAWEQESQEVDSVIERNYSTVAR